MKKLFLGLFLVSSIVVSAQTVGSGNYLFWKFGSATTAQKTTAYNVLGAMFYNPDSGRLVSYDGSFHKIAYLSDVSASAGTWQAVTDAGNSTTNNLVLNAAAVTGTDNNLILLGASTQTGGIVFGSSAALSTSTGAFFAGRGNTYSANATQRGNVYIGAGNPSSPATGEGSIIFLTGANAQRLQIKNDGTIQIGTTSVAGQVLTATGTDGSVSFTTPPTPTIYTNSATGKTANHSMTYTTANDGQNHLYRVSPYTVITTGSGAGDSKIKFTISYTDGGLNTVTSQALSLPFQTTADGVVATSAVTSNYQPVVISIAPNTTITFSWNISGTSGMTWGEAIVLEKIL